METIALLGLLGSLAGSSLNFASGVQNRNFYSETGRFNRLVDLGMNPNLAMASVAGQPSAPTAAPEFDTGSVNESLKMLMEAPQMRADVNFTEANTDFVKSQKMFTDMQSFLLPLDFQDKVRLTTATIDKFKSEGKLFDSQADYWSEMANWVEPMSQAQISEMKAHALEMQENLNLIREKVRTEISQQASNYAAANSLNANASYLDALRLLTNEQTLTQQQITQEMTYAVKSELYRSCMLGMDYTLRQSINGLPIPDDAKQYFVIASVLGDDEAKQSALDIFNLQGEINAAAYDFQQDVMLRNWGKTFLNSIAGNSGQIISSAAFAGANGMLVRGAAGKGYQKKSDIPSATKGNFMPSGTSNKWTFMGTVKNNKSGKVYKRWIKPNGEYYYEPVD